MYSVGIVSYETGLPMVDNAGLNHRAVAHWRQTYAELLIGGERRFHATGCDSGILGRRVWDTRRWVGEVAVLHIVDRSRRAFGHIVVDDLIQWASVDPRRAPLRHRASSLSEPALVRETPTTPRGVDAAGAH